MKKNSFLPLLVTNLFGTMNDNFLKTLAGFVVIGWIPDPALRPVFMGATAGALVLPYILCSPLADRLTVILPKLRIVQLAKWAELPIVAIGIVGFALHAAGLVVASILLMGLQSSLYSPSKYALVRDIGGEDRISTGMGGMEGIAFLGVLAGTIAASLMADADVAAAPGWIPFRWSWIALLAFAAAGLAGSYSIRVEEVKSRSLHAVNPLRYLRRAYRMARAHQGLNAVIVTLSVFWWAAAMLQMGLLVYGREVMKLDSTATGLMLCAAAVGIVAGQVTAGFVDRRHFLLGATPLTGWIAATLLAVLFFVPMGQTAFCVLLGLLSFDLGFFKLPFDTEIQKVAKGSKLNTMLAYFNQVSFLFMLLASGCYALVSWFFGPRAFLLLLSVVLFAVPPLFAVSYRPVLVRLGRWALNRRYDVRVDGLDCLPPQVKADAPCLVLANHPAMVDPLLVFATLHALTLRPLVDEAFFRAGLLAPMALRTVDAVKVPDLRKHRTARGATVARGLGPVVLNALARGGNVLLYPAGHIQGEADREEIGTRQMAYNLCRELPPEARVIGVRTRGLWGSIWSRAGRKSSPPFVPTLVRSVLRWIFVCPFAARRVVTMHVEDLTDRVREWTPLTRLEFNRRLEGWYGGSSSAADGRSRRVTG